MVQFDLPILMNDDELHEPLMSIASAASLSPERRSAAVFDVAIQCAALAQEHGKTAMAALHEVLAIGVLDLRHSGKASAADKLLQELGWEVKTNKRFKPWVHAAFHLDPREHAQSSLADQRATAMQALDRLLDEEEGRSGEPVALDDRSVRMAMKLIKQHGGVARLAAFRDAPGKAVDKTAEIAIDRIKAEDIRRARGMEAIAGRPAWLNGGVPEVEPTIYLKKIGCTSGEPEWIALPASRAVVDAEIRKQAVAPAPVQLLADLVRMSRTCIDENWVDIADFPEYLHSGDTRGRRLATRQLIVRAGGSLVYTTILQPDCLIVEAVPTDLTLEALFSNVPDVALWVRPNERPGVEAQLLAPERAALFDLACSERAADDDGKWRFRWVLSTQAAKDTADYSRSVVLSPASAWAERLPLDVHVVKFMPKAIARIARETFRQHVAAKVLQLMKQARRGFRAGTLDFGESVLRLDDRTGELKLPLVSLDSTGYRPVRISMHDWARARDALGGLLLADDIEVAVDPAGILRFSASTREARFGIWVPLLRSTGEVRSDAFLRPMQLTPHGKG
jgi:hypothetical protein